MKNSSPQRIDRFFPGTSTSSACHSYTNGPYSFIYQRKSTQYAHI